MSAEFRFNEAAIRKSRKDFPVTLLQAPDLRASMRPRFVNRGKCTCNRFIRVRAIASMRPRFVNRGKVIADLTRRGGQGLASMRPRFVNRGKLRTGSGHVSDSAASMRPRFVNRGKYPEELLLSCQHIRFNEAAIRKSRKARSGSR